MHEASVKTLTGSPRLAVVDEAPAGSVQYKFGADARIFMHSCEDPFVSEMEPLNWRRLEPTNE